VHLCAEACKKKIKAFEEEFEQSHGYRVSFECSAVKRAVTFPNKLSTVTETQQKQD